MGGNVELFFFFSLLYPIRRETRDSPMLAKNYKKAEESISLVRNFVNNRGGGVLCFGILLALGL